MASQKVINVLALMFDSPHSSLALFFCPSQLLKCGTGRSETTVADHDHDNVDNTTTNKKNGKSSSPVLANTPNPASTLEYVILQYRILDYSRSYYIVYYVIIVILVINSAGKMIFRVCGLASSSKSGHGSIHTHMIHKDTWGFWGALGGRV